MTRDEKILWLSELAVRIAEADSSGVKFLLESAPDADESKLRAILLAASSARESLCSRKRAEVCRLAGRLLDHPQPLIVAEAVDTLASLACSSVQKRVSALIDRTSPYVVGSVLRYLAHVLGTKAVPTLLQGLESSESIVRENAVDELDELNYKPALASIRKLLNDPDADVRQAAKSAVANLNNGSSSNDRPARSKSNRRRSPGDNKHPPMPSAGRSKERKNHPGRNKNR